MRTGLAALILVILLSACGSTPSASASPTPASTPSASPSASASASPSAVPSPSPVPSPLASPTPPDGFVCAAAAGGAVATSTVAAVRIGQHPGYDRFVIEFGGGVPSYSVKPQSSATFTRSPRGDTVTLEGTSGVLIVIHSVANWSSYTGPTTFHPGYPFLREARLVESFEGYQQWALGVRGTACLRVAVYSSPNRLVVDIAAI